MSDRQQTCDAIDDRAEIIAVTLLAIPRVQGHTDAQTIHAGKIFLQHGTLNIDRGLQRAGDGIETRTECVADGFEDVALRVFDYLAQQLVVTLDRRLHGVAMRLPALGARLDVREQKCYGASR